LAQTLQSLRNRIGMQRRQHQVPRFRRLHASQDAFPISNLA
jgi:hypothetical protein